MYRSALAILGALVAALTCVRRVGAAAEWCEHDDFMLHDVVDGKHLAIHVRVQQRSPKALLKDWSPAGNVRLVDAGEPGACAVRVIGPAHEWKATIFANHDFVMDADPATVYDAGAEQTFLLHPQIGK
jgi:hypothetical protein